MDKLKVNTENSEKFISSENQCCLCQSDLDFDYVSFPEERIIIEAAYCPLCSMKTREKEYSIQ